MSKSSHPNTFTVKTEGEEKPHLKQFTLNKTVKDDWHVTLIVPYTV
jgi:hypothetical protein